MTNEKNTEFKVDNTIESLNHNLNLIHAKSQELEQCMMGVFTFVRYGVSVNEYEDMLNYLQDLSQDIDSWTDFAAIQYSKLHCQG